MKSLTKPVRQLSDCDDLFEKRLVTSIENQGFSVVHEAESGSCYTVGLWRSQGQPELIVFGLPAERGQALLQQAAERIRQGRPLIPGEAVDCLTEAYSLQVMAVDPQFHKEYLSYARWYYRGDHFQALQLVWPDPQHRFPDHPEYFQRLREVQPQLQGNFRVVS